MYDVRLTTRAERELEGLPARYQTAIVRRLLELANWPVQGSDIKALRGSVPGTHRLRVGPYRAILSVNVGTQTITVVRIGHRSRVYQ